MKKDNNAVTKSDMQLIKRLIPYKSPAEIPVSFKLGGRSIKGIPEEFNPVVSCRMPDANMVEYVITGKNRDGLEIRAEYIEYRDFAVTEWVMYFTNTSENNSEIISDIKIMDKTIFGEEPVLTYGNGDNGKEDGYEYFKSDLTEPLSLFPIDGTSCRGAFPYMRLMFKDYGINLAIGWPAEWQADFSSEKNGVNIKIGQKFCSMYIKKGETIRTPRINLMGFTGDESRGRNLWRRWYLKHIIPRENGVPLPPKLCLHTFMIDGKPEFTGITEENQINGINKYIELDFKPDIWWIDAGWYPCNYDWSSIGTWKPDPARLPNGLAPVGKLCEENDISLLLWFEPERVSKNSELEREHPEWLLHLYDENGNEDINSLLNLGIKDCCDWIIEKVDKIIKDNHVHIYRQDFNYAVPLSAWIENEEENRKGALENFHVQGYLRYWDELILRNPGLWIDSCAGGGRRNDLDTMRRAVPLHYTDTGYGNHPVKQKQYREMFEWIPYFRSHTLNGDNAEGNYNGGSPLPVDEFAYHNAFAPSLTSMVEYYDSEERIKMGNKFHPVWRDAAELMLRGDYYPLTECRRCAEDYYAAQFDDNEHLCGFIQVIRNIAVKEDSVTLYPEVDETAVYSFTEKLTGEKRTASGKELKNGFTVSVPKRSGAVWFYNRS